MYSIHIHGLDTIEYDISYLFFKSPLLYWARGSDGQWKGPAASAMSPIFGQFSTFIPISITDRRRSD